MPATNISTVSSSTTTTPKVVEYGDNSSLDKNAFLKLLTVQLSNQDPLNPMDSSDMAAQQTQYAQVEQLMNLNSTMESFIESQEDTMLGIASVFNTLESSNFLGKNVSFYTNKMTVSETGEVSSMQYDLSEDALVGWTVYDANGAVVKAQSSQAVSAGKNLSIGWDGTDASGKPVEEGTYTVKMDVLNAEGESLTGKTYAELLVKGIDFRSGTPLMTLSDGRQINVTDIVSVSTN